MFLRQSTVGREPLAIAMSGVRMGERLLQIGMDTPVVTGLLAAKPGLSGESSIVVVDEATATQVRRAISETGALVNVAVHTPGCPSLRRRFDSTWSSSTTGMADWPVSLVLKASAGACRMPSRSSVRWQGRRAG